jgi:hypothetical protein
MMCPHVIGVVAWISEHICRDQLATERYEYA